jgi:SulP family sulfate permease
LNVAATLITFIIVFGLPKLLEALGKGNLKKFLPSTLIGIVLVTALCIPFSELQHVEVGEPIDEFSDVSGLFSYHFPNQWGASNILKALPSAANLLMLCYLDTLLTSLVMDQKVDEKYGDQAWRKTNQNFELMSQGVANGFCAFFGGLPGAQATIRSVLILNEGARSRLAGICVGLFVVVEMIALQSLIGMIPSAVFSGVLLKVGYDVLDWPPAWTYIKTMLLKKPHPTGDNDVHVAHIDMLFIIGTTLVTVFVNLNVAVAAFTLLFFLGRLVVDIPDMKTTAELKKVAGSSVISESGR